MKRLALFIGALVLTLAGAGAFLGASLMVDTIERITDREVSEALNDEKLDWVSVRTDGLWVHVSGAAPDEASRFKALGVTKRMVNNERVVDAIKIVDPDDLGPPKFSLELLRNGDGISMIGLIPESTGRDFVLKSIDDIDDETTVTDMLETADFQEPDGWKEAVDFALDSLRSLPRSKISVTPMQVVITAITDSQEEKAAIEAKLESNRPEKVALIMKISAPRPVITPFSLRLIKDELGTRFDSCSADNEASVANILHAAEIAGLDKGTGRCAIGLGAPSPRWGEAAVTAIRALNELGGGSLTFSDADITLVAHDRTNQIDFDRIVYNLEQGLPDVFSVHAVLPPKPVLEGQEGEPDAPEFLATKSPEGLVQMRGRLRDQRAQISINNFAKAQFGGEHVHDTTRIDPNLPDGWPLRVLAGLEALAKLHNGSLLVQPEMLELRGVADRPEVSTEVTQIFSEKLGDSSRYQISVSYIEALNQQEQLPSPEECVERINEILTVQQISFATSSTKIEDEAMEVVEKIAEAMADCSEVPMEIGGHTDSHGREKMNLTLSQARAEAVLDALLSLEVLTTFLSAKGYGESEPLADNKTEEGRKANRRIEFRLITEDTSEETDETGESEDSAPEESAKEETSGQD